MSRARVLVLALLALCATLPTGASAQTPQKRVFNGFAAGPGEYPWTVAIARSGESVYNGQFCGGTLVSATVVVTAAHCVWDREAASIDVAVGIRDLSAGTAADRHAVAAIALHPLETAESDDELRYDAAILTLATPVADAATRAVGVAPASTAPFLGGQALTVSGWGRTASGYPDRMMAGDITGVSDADCAAAWTPFRADDMVCALRVIAGPKAVDACDGDSGGPLVTRPADPLSPAGVQLVGAVSWGTSSCEDPTGPGVYTRIAAPAINAWVRTALDADPANGPFAKPEAIGGLPAVTGTLTVGRTITCSTGTFTFEDHGNPSTTELVLRRYDGADPVALGTVPHTLVASDAGHRFGCHATGRVTGAGGFVTALSPQSDVVAPAPVVPDPDPTDPDPTDPGTPTDPDPTTPTTPQTPSGGTTTPAPAATPAPTPRVEAPTRPAVTTGAPDRSRPTVTAVARTCRARRCTFTVTARDSGSGVASVRITLRSGKRSRTLKAKLTRGRWVVTTPKLARGAYTVTIRATDAAGNAQRRATTRTFSLR